MILSEGQIDAAVINTSTLKHRSLVIDKQLKRIDWKVGREVMPDMKCS